MGSAARTGATRELRNEFSWSHSRHDAFLSCPRRYYFHYYGSWGGWSEGAEARVRRLYVLKNLKSRQMWAGGVVHDVVADVLRRVRRDGFEQAGLLDEAAAAADRAVARLRREFRESRAGAYLEDPRHAVGLLEHHYRESVPDEQWRDLAEGVRAAVLRFHQGPYLEDLRRLPADAWLALEDLTSFPLDGVTVYVKLDLAVRATGGDVAIIDWKTGRREPRPEGLQLGTYALHAVEHWKAAPDAIEVREVNLTTGAEGTQRVSASQLEAARTTIRESIRQMRAKLLDAAENRAREEDFATRPGPRTCPRCPFREICPETRPAGG